jgi:hypothetical protein
VTLRRRPRGSPAPSLAAALVRASRSGIPQAGSLRPGLWPLWLLCLTLLAALAPLLTPAATAGAAALAAPRAGGGSLGAVPTTLPARVYHYTDPGTAALIEQSQLGLPGRTLFLTPPGNLTPAEAQSLLDLPASNTAAAVFEVDAAGLDPARVQAIRRVAPYVYGHPGGGIEILYDGTVELRYVRRIR